MAECGQAKGRPGSPSPEGARHATATAPDGAQGIPGSAALRATEAGDVSALDKALAAGADPNARGRRGWTPLMHAADKGYKLLVPPLLKAGAKPDIQAADGATALFIAALHGRSGIVELLMKAGADPSIKGPKDRTAVDVARMKYGDAKAARKKKENPAVLALLEGITWSQVKAKADDAAFAKTRSAGTLAAYAEYLSEYPQRRHVKETLRLKAQTEEQDRRLRAQNEEMRRRGWVTGKTFSECPACPEMVVVPAGLFMMGSPTHEAKRDDSEGPRHRVTVPKPFAVGKYEVTFAEWDACVKDGGCGGYRPGDAGWGRGSRPVIYVSWHDAKAYVKWLSRKTGKRYRLLSEAEWEYAARAATTTPFHFGETISTSQANYGNSGGTVAVGSFPANAFGLHDVHGNVFEWVEDCRNKNYEGAPTDASAWTDGDCGQRVLRGGSSYLLRPEHLRSANREFLRSGVRDDNYGFRVARTLAP